MTKLALEFVLLIITSVTLPVTATAKKEVYYGCETGFLYESKQDAAHCIKQEKIFYKPPIACNMSGDRSLQYKLVVDKVGLNDQCVLQESTTKPNQQLGKQMTNKAVQKLFGLKCQSGYQLTIRKGKDACSKGNREEIKPPSKRIIR